MQDITVTELKEYIDSQKDFILIDVREPYEFQAYNIGGYLIPLATLQHAIEEWTELKDKEFVVICRSGARSAAAKNFLEYNGFANVRNLLRGLLEWQSKF